MSRIAWVVAIAFGLAGCSKAEPTNPKYWEKLFNNPKKSDEALSRIGDELKEPAQREWGAKLVLRFYDRGPEKAAVARGKLRFPEPAAVDKLTEALRSNDPGLMAKAAKALRRLGGRKAIPELVRILEKWTPKHPRDLTPVRMEVTKALGAFQAKEGVPGLMKMARERSHGLIVNLRAIEALGRIGDARAIPALVESLYLACPEDKCSAEARAALNRIGKRAVPALMRVVFREDPAIEKLATEKKLSEATITAVPFIVLGDIGDRAMAETLGERYLRAKDSFTKVNAISAIGFTAGPDLVGALIRAYKKSLLEARTNILHALHRIGNPKAIPFLLSVIKKREDPNLLWTAGLAVSYLGGADELDDIEAVVKREKRRLPGMRGEDAAITKQTITFFESFASRLRAAKGCRDDVCWSGRISSPDKQVRIKAARMLAFAKERKVAEDSLLGALADADAGVREEVAFALGKVGTPKPATIEALEKRIQEDKDKPGMKGPLFLYQLLAARLRGRAEG